MLLLPSYRRDVSEQDMGKDQGRLAVLLIKTVFQDHCTMPSWQVCLRTLRGACSLPETKA